MSANLKVAAPGMSIYSEGKVRPSIEQSMAGYGRSFAAEATQMARRLIRTYNVSQAKEAFEAMTVRELTTFEAEWEAHIANFMLVADIARPGLLRQIEANHGKKNAVLFLTVCIMAALRAGKVIELREKHYGVLVPGSSNRATIAGIYEFSRAMQKINAPEWPEAAFRASRREAEH